MTRTPEARSSTCQATTQGGLRDGRETLHCLIVTTFPRVGAATIHDPPPMYTLVHDVKYPGTSSRWAEVRVQRPHVPRLQPARGERPPPLKKRVNNATEGGDKVKLIHSGQKGI